MIFCGTLFASPQFPYRGHDMIFWIFPVVLCLSVLHVTLANLQEFGFELHLRSSPSAFSGYGWPVDQLITSLLVTLCWRDPTRSKQLSTVAILGFQFGLYYDVDPLSFLRSISPALLFSRLSIFGWPDLLQILRKPSAFSFVVLCIIVYCLVSNREGLGTSL